MNRLWVRLSLLISAIMIGGALLFGVLPSLLLTSGASDAVVKARLQSPNGLAARLETYYATNDNWTGVQELMRRYDFSIPRGFGGHPSVLILSDQNGSIVYDGLGQRNGIPLSADEKQNAIPLLVGGATRGYLLLQPITLPPPDPGGEPNSLVHDLLNNVIGFALGVGAIGVFAGVVVSRQLAAPLSQLAETVRAFGKPNFTQRASVTGSLEVREVASAFNEMADALAEGESLRRSLVGDVAHELRTPLSVLEANLQAILDDVYPLDKDEIQRLKDQTDLLRRLVNDLHELAQAEARRLPIHVTNINLNDLIESVVERFTAMTQAQSLTLGAVLPDMLVQYRADPDRITEVLHNLIQNAVTHTPSGGSITVTLMSDGRGVHIGVQDTGIGIAKNDQTRIFERFYRTDESRSRVSGGAGLGLPIARAIVELHGGHIDVFSEGVGHGTTFTVHLPTQAGADRSSERYTQRGELDGVKSVSMSTRTD